jgi:hydrogenase nickel incorporation protein HypB
VAGGRQTIEVTEALLGKNEALARANRDRFAAHGLLVLNVLSSPGSGKTALLQRTASDLAGRVRIGVIVGDLQTDNDARRIRESGAPAVQVETGGYCHLEARMVARAADELPLDTLDVLIIENVGNLVCPAGYDLGEHKRVVLFSVTEGEDKPLKYPTLFSTADIVIISKTDIAGAVGFDRDAALHSVRAVAPRADVYEVSARSGAGLEEWYAALEGALAAVRNAIN